MINIRVFEVKAGGHQTCMDNVEFVDVWVPQLCSSVYDSSAGLLEGPGKVPEGTIRANELFYAEMAGRPDIARALRSNDEREICRIMHLSPKHQYKREKLKRQQS